MASASQCSRVQRSDAEVRKLRFIEEKKVFDRWEFFLHNQEEIRIEFVYYDFPALKPRKKIKGILTDSIEDLAANKSMAILERHEPKDIVDIYFLMKKKKWNLIKLLGLLKKKFGLKFDESTFLGEILRGCRRLNEILPLLSGVQPKKTVCTIKAYFERLGAQYLKKQW